jgi:DNA-3-methyladenine glycosylase II
MPTRAPVEKLNRYMVNPADQIAVAIEYLRARDPVMAEIIERVGKCEIRSEPDLFTALVRAIISQQISTSAARSIYGRVMALRRSGETIAEALCRATPDELRAAGVSPQKMRYLKDLALKAVSGVIRLDAIERLSNEEIIRELTQVKGVGVWTVQMLLIFSLGRLNVLPADDLGVRTAIKRLYKKRSVPKPRQLAKFHKLWQPYASIASWYCWRSLELE